MLLPDPVNPIGDFLDVTLRREEWEEVLVVARGKYDRERATRVRLGEPLNEPPGSYVPDPLGHLVNCLVAAERALEQQGNPIQCAVSLYEGSSLCGVPLFAVSPEDASFFRADVNGVKARGRSFLPDGERGQVEHWLWQHRLFERGVREGD